jgi:hypothetical protein
MDDEVLCRSCGSGALEWSRIRCHGRVTGIIGIVLAILTALGAVAYVLVLRSEPAIQKRAAIPTDVVRQRLRQSSTPDDVATAVIAGKAVSQERLRALSKDQLELVRLSESVMRAKRLTPKDINAIKSCVLGLSVGGLVTSWMLLRKKRVWHCGSCGDASFLHPGQ